LNKLFFHYKRITGKQKWIFVFIFFCEIEQLLRNILWNEHLKHKICLQLQKYLKCQIIQMFIFNFHWSKWANSSTISLEDVLLSCHELAMAPAWFMQIFINKIKWLSNDMSGNLKKQTLFAALPCLQLQQSHSQIDAGIKLQIPNSMTFHVCELCSRHGYGIHISVIIDKYNCIPLLWSRPPLNFYFPIYLVEEIITGAIQLFGVHISMRLCMTFVCVTCDVKTERWGQLIFASRKYLSPPFGFHVIHNLKSVRTGDNRKIGRLD